MSGQRKVLLIGGPGAGHVTTLPDRFTGTLVYAETGMANADDGSVAIPLHTYNLTKAHLGHRVIMVGVHTTITRAEWDRALWDAVLNDAAKEVIQ